MNDSSERAHHLAIPLGTAVALPGVLVLLSPGALTRWPVVAAATLSLTAGAGTAIRRPWGLPLAVLASLALALESGARWLEGSRSAPLWTVFAIGTGAACAFALFAQRDPKPLTPAPRPVGPDIRRALAAVAFVYLATVSFYFVYHRIRGIDAPLGLAVRGSDLPALLARSSFYVLCIASAFIACKHTPSTPGSPRRDIASGLLLFLATFALLTLIGSVIDIVAALGDSRAAEVATGVRTGIEAETARPAVGFDPVRFAFVALLAPVGEELLFRWTLYRSLRTRMPFLAAALLQAALFAVLHDYRFAAYQALVIGLASAWSVERTRRVLPAIVAHGLWNGIQSIG